VKKRIIQHVGGGISIKNKRLIRDHEKKGVMGQKVEEKRFIG